MFYYNIIKFNNMDKSDKRILSVVAAVWIIATLSLLGQVTDIKAFEAINQIVNILSWAFVTMVMVIVGMVFFSNKKNNEDHSERD